MKPREDVMYVLVSLFLAIPTAHGGIDLNQNGLTGMWYEPQTSGQGFAVEVLPDLLAPGTGMVQITWFTFDEVAGGAERQRWYTLGGPVASGQTQASLTIYRNTGGNFDAPPRTMEQPVGTATLSFDSCTSGQLTYNFTDGSGRASTIPLTRLMPDVLCSKPTIDVEYYLRTWFDYSGNWYNAPTSGQGLTFEVNPHNGLVFFGWATYAPNGAAAGTAGQRWYTGQSIIDKQSARAVLVLGQPFAVQLYETTIGVFDATAPSGPTTAKVGTATLTFDSCETATLGYSFVGGSSNGSAGTISLTRVSPLPRVCPGPWDY